MGALYGPVAFIWIVVSCIFVGAVHVYLTGVISIRNHGAHLPELPSKFLGKFMKHIVNAFAVLLLLLVGTVFVTTPAELLHMMLNGKLAFGVISEASTMMLGAIGGTLAVLGVVILPITSGDTAFRSARMIIAEYLSIAQRKFSSRLWIAVPLFAISLSLTQIDFNILWRYLSWASNSSDRSFRRSDVLIYR
jgi:carbon starvation protein CstA